MEINKEDLENYPNRYRATLINSLSGIKTAVLVGTQSKEGVTNLAIFNSLIHIGAKPIWQYSVLFFTLVPIRQDMDCCLGQTRFVGIPWRIF